MPRLQAASRHSAKSTAPPITSATEQPVAPRAPVDPVAALRECFLRDGQALVIKPVPLFEVGSFDELLTKLHGKSSQHGARAARSALCRERPPDALCASSDCSRDDVSFIWLNDGPFRYTAALVLHTDPSTIRVYAAGAIYNFNEDICRVFDTQKLNCDGNAYLDVQRPASHHFQVQSSYFAAAGRFCNSVTNEQTWLVDAEGRALALFLMKPTSLQASLVRITEREVEVEVRAPKQPCRAGIGIADLLAHGPDGAVTSWEF